MILVWLLFKGHRMDRCIVLLLSSSCPSIRDSKLNGKQLGPNAPEKYKLDAGMRQRHRGEKWSVGPVFPRTDLTRMTLCFRFFGRHRPSTGQFVHKGKRVSTR